MNNKIEARLVLKRSIKRFINKVLITTIIVLIGLIIIKYNPDFKNYIKEKVYDNNINFNKTKSIYEKYFGNILSVEKNIKKTNAVFLEEINYSKIDKYKKGVKLRVTDNYMIPVIESGVVVFVGEKNGYHNSIVVEQTDGVETIYGNVKINNLKLYDYVEKGELLGEVQNNEVFLSFIKEASNITLLKSKFNVTK